jgi:hypothetical protein
MESSSLVYSTIVVPTDEEDEVDLGLVGLLRKSSSIALACSRNFLARSSKPPWSLLLLVLSSGLEVERIVETNLARCLLGDKWNLVGCISRGAHEKAPYLWSMEPWNIRKMHESTTVREKVSPTGLAGRVWMEIIAAAVAERA